MGLLSNLLSAKILYLKKDLTMWKCFFSFPIKHVTSLLLGCSANAVPAPELKYCYHLGYFRIKSVLLGTSKDWFRGFAIAYRRKWNVSINQVLINQIFCWFSQKIICPLGNKAPRKIKKYFHEQVVVVGVVVVGVVVVVVVKAGSRASKRFRSARRSRPRCCRRRLSATTRRRFAPVGKRQILCPTFLSTRFPPARSSCLSFQHRLAFTTGAW